MPSVTYIEFNGTTHTVEVPVGTSLMRRAVDNNIPGIDADCGGDAPAPPVTRMSMRRGWTRPAGRNRAHKKKRC